MLPWLTWLETFYIVFCWRGRISTIHLPYHGCYNVQALLARYHVQQYQKFSANQRKYNNQFSFTQVFPNIFIKTDQGMKSGKLLSNTKLKYIVRLKKLRFLSHITFLIFFYNYSKVFITEWHWTLAWKVQFRVFL